MDTIESLHGKGFLPPDSDLSQRWTALRLNVQAWFLYCAHTSEHPSTFRTGEIICTTSHCIIPSEEAVQDDQLLDSIIAWYREHRQNGAIIWYLHPTPPFRLGGRLYARGVSPNWEPHWMWYDLQVVKRMETQSDAFMIQTERQTATTSSGDDHDCCVVWKVKALREQTWLGGCLVNITTGGGYGVAGLFDMYVLEQERKQGIGTALVQAACELAVRLGCHHLVLNATEAGEKMYERAGFKSMGKGHTWFLKDATLVRLAPTSEQVDFLEAVGTGDIKKLDAMRNCTALDHISEETLNELTPLEIAVHCNKPTSAEWLIDHGAVPDIMSLWDLGFRDRIPTVIAAHPILVKRKAGRWTATPLHIAIERNDMEMVKLLLSVSNDLDCKDGVFHSTPLEWAKHFQRTEIITLLKGH